MKQNDENNPFYSFIDKSINKESQTSILGLSKINLVAVVIILIILTLGITGVYFFNKGVKEKRISDIGDWYEGLGQMICENDEECTSYFDSTVKDAFIENNFIPSEKIDTKELKKQFQEELQVFENITFDANNINVWVDKCSKHPDIQTGIAIRHCAFSMMLLDQHFN